MSVIMTLFLEDNIFGAYASLTYDLQFKKLYMKMSRRGIF